MPSKEIKVNLDKAKETAKVERVFVGRKNEELEIDIHIVHNARKTISKVLVKVVLYDNATFRFNGRIRVLKKAHLSEGYLRLQALLIGDNCRVSAEPALEIENNSVKCFHKVSISKLNEEEIFYLISKGLERDSAIDLVVQGFVRAQP